MPQLGLNILTGANLLIIMSAIRVQSLHSEPRAPKNTGVSRMSDRLASEFMLRVRDMDRKLGIDPYPLIRRANSHSIRSELVVEEIHLNYIFTKLLDRANDPKQKATDDLLMEDIPSTAALLLKAHFFNGDAEMAEATARRFAITERIEFERADAHFLRNEAQYGGSKKESIKAAPVEDGVSLPEATIAFGGAEIFIEAARILPT